MAAKIVLDPSQSLFYFVLQESHSQAGSPHFFQPKASVTVSQDATKLTRATQPTYATQAIHTMYATHPSQQNLEMQLREALPYQSKCFFYTVERGRRGVCKYYEL